MGWRSPYTEGNLGMPRALLIYQVSLDPAAATTTINLLIVTAWHHLLQGLASDVSTPGPSPHPCLTLCLVALPSSQSEQARGDSGDRDALCLLSPPGKAREKMESEPLYNLLQLPKEVDPPTEEELPRGAGPGGTRVVESGEGESM